VASWKFNGPHIDDNRRTGAGCSKRPFSKAAASEEARRYVPHFVWAVRPCKWFLANGKAPTVFPTSKKLLLSVEPLSDARTPLADFFSILLDRERLILLKDL
jgi:hypothetical protein